MVEQIETNRDAVGNTESTASRKKDQGTQSSYWFFTLFGYDLKQIETIEQILSHECDWYLFQEEVCPETGRDHLQGTLKWKSRKRRTQCVKIIMGANWNPTISISSSIVYCSKELSKKIGGGRWYRGITVPEPIRVCEPYGWQLDVLNIVASEPDERTIHWFWEPTGNVGKSQLCKYLVVKNGAIMLSGKSADMFHLLSKTKVSDIKCIIVDASRDDCHFINYSAIEKIKNGLIFSGKYDGRQLVFNSPHIIVFANSPPDEERLSKDRWHITKIKVIK